MGYRVSCALVGFVLVLGGCVAPSMNACPTVDCPFDEVCDGHGGCAKQAALDVCRGMPDGAGCSYSDTPAGQCAGQLCLPVGCGNQFVTGTEVCDDGNTVNGDGCSADCLSTEACGNGIVDPAKGEQCDDANAVDGDGCQASCKFPRCGDGIRDDGLNEQCDVGNTNSLAPNAPCRPNCQLPRCGDGVLDGGEVCDDGDVTSGDGCAGDCKSNEMCGNSTIDVIKGEICDDGGTVGGDGCSANCRSSEGCGNGVLDAAAGELCDDGNLISGDDCSSDCRSLEVCGNAIIDVATGEQCDKGLMFNSDAPDAACRINCRLPRCGDGVVDPGLGEACDAGAANSELPDAACRPTCQPPRCGDRVRDMMRGEVCDDGNSVAADGCSPDCGSTEICGNGVTDVATGEQCDAGASNADMPNAACRTTCKFPRCGDGIPDTLFAEGCDLGALNSSAANANCRLNCQPQRCGDGVLDDAMMEVCDDGNVSSGDSCSADCRSDESCGNGITDFATGERCDDENTENIDLCHNDCSQPQCGDAIVDVNEACDAGGANANSANAPCRTSCQLPRCGDNILDTARGEMCDDGNLIPGDGCRPDCRSNETCGNGVLDVLTGEMCDDGNLRGRDGCSACRPETAIVLTPGAAPSARVYHQMAYDAARQRVVLFGGVKTILLGDTWEWDGASWTQMQPTQAPPVRYRAGMAYDARRRRVVLFGGDGTNGARNDTWEYDGVTWTQLQPATSPSPRSGTAMAYDAVRGTIILYGGSGYNDTWEWNGTTWAQLAPTGNPGAAHLHMMTYDTARNQIVMRLYGANKPTWVWSGATTTWTNKGVGVGAMPTGPNLAMAYDSNRGRVVLVPTTTPTTIPPTTPTTWEWDGSVWTPTQQAGPVGRQGAFAVYDAARRQLVMFGGGSLGDTWLRTGTTWSPATGFVQPSPRVAAAAAYDPLRKKVVMYGGNGGCGYCTLSDETWEWDGRRWESVGAGPTAQSGGWLDYNTSSRTMMLFGGTSDVSPRDLYQFDGVSWSPAASGTRGDTYVRRTCMAYDRSAGQVVTFGGRDRDNGTAEDTTWSWTAVGGWITPGPSTVPPRRFQQPCAYDPVRERTVMFGGRGENYGTLGDVWEWTGGDWQALAATGPAGRFGTSLAYNGDLQRMVLFGNAPGAGRGHVGVVGHRVDAAHARHRDPVAVPLVGRVRCRAPRAGRVRRARSEPECRRQDPADPAAAELQRRGVHRRHRLRPRWRGGVRRRRLLAGMHAAVPAGLAGELRGHDPALRRRHLQRLRGLQPLPGRLRGVHGGPVRRLLLQPRRDRHDLPERLLTAERVRSRPRPGGDAPGARYLPRASSWTTAARRRAQNRQPARAVMPPAVGATSKVGSTRVGRFSRTNTAPPMATAPPATIRLIPIAPLSSAEVFWSRSDGWSTRSFSHPEIEHSRLKLSSKVSIWPRPADHTPRPTRASAAPPPVIVHGIQRGVR